MEGMELPVLELPSVPPCPHALVVSCGLLAARLCHCEVKDRTFIDCAFGPNTTSMFPDDSVHSSQPDACPLKVVGSMQSLKYTKQFVSIFHIESNPIVANKN